MEVQSELPVLSRDGRYLAYNLLPSDADGEFVVRNLVTGGEQRIPRGRSGTGFPGIGAAPSTSSSEEYEDDDQRRPYPPGTGTPPGEGVSPLAGAIHQFTPDSKVVVFALIPTKVELDKARLEKKTAAELPRPIVAVVDLSSGKITAKIERVTSFAVVGDGAGLLVYKRQVKPAEKTAPMKEEKKDEKTPVKAVARTYGTDLVIRNLADDVERTIPDVIEHSVSRDGKTLVYAVSSKTEDGNGVYAIRSLPGGPAAALLSGKGKYNKLTWDEKQMQLVFFSDKEDAAAAKPKSKIYHWDRNSSAKPLGAGGADLAADLLGPTPQGIRAGWSITERGTVNFSPDGTRLYVSTAPEREPEKTDKPAPTAPATPPADDGKVVVDLWHYKDAYIQPMQKARSSQEQNRTYRAVYFIKDKSFRQLSDETGDVVPAAAGDFALGADNRKYRHLTGYGPELSDYAVVNVRSGDASRCWRRRNGAERFRPAAGTCSPSMAKIGASPPSPTARKRT